MRGISHSLAIMVCIIYHLMSGITTVKINVEGTLSLGRDVIGSISQFLGNTFIKTRRSIIPVTDEDPITEIVRTVAVCRKLEFCLRLRQFTEEYLSVLAISIQRILEELQKGSFNRILYKEQLKHYLEIVRDVLESTNTEVTDETEVYYWIKTLKTISGRFQEMASIFVNKDLQDGLRENTIKREDLYQKLIIATVLVEMKYQIKLCADHNICVKSYEFTKSLGSLLGRFNTTTEDKVRKFVRHVYEALFDTAFYTYISERTAHELQVLLNDMAYSNEVPTKELLLMAHKFVESRLESMKTNRDEKLSHDAILANVILSDMDHVYSGFKPNPFGNFLENVWVLDDHKLDKEIRKAMTDVGDKLKVVSDDLFTKLMNEVKVFLEINVDPEKSVEFTSVDGVME